MRSVAGPTPRTGSAPASLRWRLCVATAVLGYGALAVLLLVQSPSSHATYSSLALAVTLLAAGALLLGGCATVLARRYRIAGLLGLLAGSAWLASSFVGWLGGPVWVRAVALVVAPLAVPLLLHLVLVAPPEGRSARRLSRGVERTAYLLTAGVTAVTALSRDPLVDPHCWHDCNLRVLAVLPDREAASVATRSGLALVVTLAVVGAAAAAWRIGRAAPGIRVPRAVVTGPAVLALVGYAAWAWAVLADPPERPAGGWFQAAHLAQAVGFLLLGTGLGALVVREHRRRRGLRRLAGRLGAVPPVGSLETHLGQVLDDPSLQVAHWLPEAQQFVDSAGRAVTPERSGDRTGAELRRGDDLLAVVTLGRADLDDEDLAAQLGSATRLALDNERLQAGIRAQLAELRRSRERIVEAADEARRQLERDLHDGVQADLVALLLEASRRLAIAQRHGDEDAAEVLGEVVEQVAAAVARLRDLTHGIYPAELVEAGLEAALWTLTDEAPVPVALRVSLEQRPPAAVERVAYLVAIEALSLVGGTGVLHLEVVDPDSVVLVRVAPIREPAPVGLVDRAGALGGVVRCADDAWEVELPCESS